MSKEEMKQIGEYQRWRLGVIVYGSMAGALLAFFLLFFVGFTVTQGIKMAGMSAVFAVPVVVFVPFFIYFGVQMIDLRKHAADYTKITVSIISAEHDEYYHREGGAYVCSALYAETNTTVRFTVYMRYVPHGVDLERGKLVEVWYNAKDDEALFANKVKQSDGIV